MYLVTRRINHKYYYDLCYHRRRYSSNIHTASSTRQTNSSYENLEVFLSLLFSTVTCIVIDFYMIVSYNTMIVFYINCRLEANCNDDIRSDLKALDTFRQSLMRGIIGQNIQDEIKLVY